MATIQRFEDIEAWQKARELTRLVYRMTKQTEFSRDFGLKDQIRRAAVSIMSNIAEGFERGGDREFVQFLAQSKGSTGEVKAQLYVALDAEYITQTQFDEAYRMCNDVTRLIGAFIRYLRSSSLRGPKFRTSP